MVGRNRLELETDWPQEKTQAKRRKGTVRRRNAFSVMMEIKGGLKPLERVTRGKLTLWEEGKNQWKADAKRQLTFPLEMDDYPSCPRLRNAQVPEQAGGGRLCSPFIFSSFQVVDLLRFMNYLSVFIPRKI